jgi:hypothetical protein
LNTLSTISSLSRRDLFRRAGGGFGMLALGALLERSGVAANAINPLAPKPPHFRRKQNR